MGKKNTNRRPQTPKVRNEEWMRARLDHTNRNLTVPSGRAYKRKPKHKEW